MKTTMNRTVVLGFAIWVGLASAASCASSDRPHPGVGAPHPMNASTNVPLPATAPALASASAQAPDLCRPPSHADAFEQRTGFKLSPVERAIMDDCPSRAWSKSVPKHGCAKDDECGEGYCDQGQCALIWTCNRRYGQRCETDDHCDAPYTYCSEGRCRSLRDSEMLERALGGTLSSLDKTIIDTCPRRAWTHNVPKRRCTKDVQCGDGFCDRGRCVARWTCGTHYGLPCKDNDQCDSHPCINGRCRSCTSESDCDWKRGGKVETNITCIFDGVIPGAYGCIGEVHTGLGHAGPYVPPPPPCAPTSRP
jgi:hypothetical protein